MQQRPSKPRHALLKTDHRQESVSGVLVHFAAKAFALLLLIIEHCFLHHDDMAPYDDTLTATEVTQIMQRPQLRYPC